MGSLITHDSVQISGPIQILTPRSVNSRSAAHRKLKFDALIVRPIMFIRGSNEGKIMDECDKVMAVQLR